MNISELLTDLAEQGVQLQANQDKLSIRSSKGLLTPDLKAKLTEHKSDILAFLNQKSSANPNASGNKTLCGQTGLSAHTVGRLISGYGDRPATDYRPPVMSQVDMARQLTVTFRPLPTSYSTPEVITFREELHTKLEQHGVTVKPWEDVLKDYAYDLKLPFGLKLPVQVKLVSAGVSAVVDVERRPSGLRRLAMAIAELFYVLYCFFNASSEPPSIFKIAEVAGWAEDNARVEDPTNTQVIILSELNPEMANLDVPYRAKIKLGLNTLIQNFSEMVVGVSADTLSILNMNLSDSIFPRSEVDRFVLNSLIPKIFVPILPLPLSRFAISEYDPQQSDYAKQLVNLGKALDSSGLFPAGSKLSEVITRKSHRDIVNLVMNGRTGVSYGFVAYAEPPQYVGDPIISAAEWQTLVAVEGFSAEELRQNLAGRWYLKLPTRQGDENAVTYHQIPDIWLVCSRSGSNKTNLDLSKDVTRIGLCKQLMLQLPKGTDAKTTDIKPSYDLYVMVAIALAAALYTPNLIQNGAPIIHFHGYPNQSWFQPHEYCAGVTNPSVPCGTYESGVFNFMSIHSLQSYADDGIALATLIEPDHGSNIIAQSIDYLLQRLQVGIQANAIDLGGKHFASLK
jgi:TubC N-terminal docking domain